jgi:hypothetical protein
MIKLELTLDEVNYILQQVGKAPFAECAPLINKIHMQASPQVSAVGTGGDTEAVHTHEETRTIMGNTETVIVEDAK